MLSPDTRAVLIDALRPPAGQLFDAAIATTFTLDLTAAVIPPLAFSSLATGNASLGDPVTVLESVRAAADRVDIFCQGGNIAIPGRASDLLAFAEPMVHEVRRPAGHLFHPKVWFARYRDEDDSKHSYRLLVLTRNLTHGQSWDVAVCLDSASVARRQLPENKDLFNFLRDLPDRAITALSDIRRERVTALAREARYVQWEKPEGVSAISFHYLKGKKRPDFEGRRHLVISPFLNDAGINVVVPEGQEAAVISRASALDGLSPQQLDRLKAYVMDPLAGIATTSNDGDDGASDLAQDRNVLSGLHAKVYVIEPWGRAHRARVLIGSANATDAAFAGNVEFLVEFEGPRRSLGVDTFIGEDGSILPLLQPYETTGGAEPAPEEDELRNLENHLRAIAEIRHTVSVHTQDSAQPDGRHNVQVTAADPYPLQDGWEATVELLTLPGYALQVKPDQPLNDSLTAVITADISPFLSVRLTSPTGLQGGTVLLASLVGDPEDRLDLVLARQIDTPEKFLRFLYLILSLGDPHFLAQLAAMQGAGGNRFTSSGGGPGILELVLRALADKPDALDDLARLVERLRATEEGRALMPPGFEDLWTQALLARDMVEKKR